MSSESASEIKGSNNDSISILDSGDRKLLLTYSGNCVAIGVSSHAMCLASPVWNKIINPPFSKLPSEEEGNGDSKDKQIDFSDDNGKALLLLLRIAHLQFHKVPLTLTFESILDVAILCDKYDCVGLVTPWLSLWVFDKETQSMEQGHEEWLFIAWVFGREKTFEKLAKKLVKEVRMNDKGDCLRRDSPESDASGYSW